MRLTKYSVRDHVYFHIIIEYVQVLVMLLLPMNTTCTAANLDLSTSACSFGHSGHTDNSRRGRSKDICWSHFG